MNLSILGFQQKQDAMNSKQKYQQKEIQREEKKRCDIKYRSDMNGNYNNGNLNANANEKRRIATQKIHIFKSIATKCKEINNK